MVLKPAALVVIDWKVAFISFTGTDIGPRVCSFPYSNAKTTATPRSHSAPLDTSTILLSRLKREKRRTRARSAMTAKLSPPRTISTAITPSTSGSPANAPRLEESRTVVNPALLNPLTDWKIPCQAASAQPHSKTCRNRTARTIPPTNWNARAVTIRLRISRSTPPICAAPTDSWKASRCGNVIRCPTRIKMNPARVIHPSPPTRMSAQITACPAKLQYTGVSTTTSPVTVTADVAVKSASMKGVHSPVVLANGKRSSAAPKLTRNMRPATSVAGDAMPWDGRRGRGTLNRLEGVSRERGRRTI